MPRSKTRGKTARSRRRTFAESVEFPRWILAAETVLIGLMLLLGALSDSSGAVRSPGVGSIVFIAAVIGIAVAVIHRGRNRSSDR